jgi:hypothetical protein
VEGDFYDVLQGERVGHTGPILAIVAMR